MDLNQLQWDVRWTSLGWSLLSYFLVGFTSFLVSPTFRDLLAYNRVPTVVFSMLVIIVPQVVAYLRNAGVIATYQDKLAKKVGIGKNKVAFVDVPTLI